MSVLNQVSHPLRESLVKEIHARPFLSVNAPCQIAYLVLMHEATPSERDRQADRELLAELLTHFDVPMPAERDAHFTIELPNGLLKWENHTEFTSYLLKVEGAHETFSTAVFDFFPDKWLQSSNQQVLCATLIDIPDWRISGMLPLTDGDHHIDASESFLSTQEIVDKIRPHFDSDTLAISKVLNNSAIIAGDFRIDENGYKRFVVLPNERAASGTIGRICQWIVEIETYLTGAMMTLPMARKLGKKMSAMDESLQQIVMQLHHEDQAAEAILDDLLALSAQIEHEVARTSFRFAACKAYAQIVDQRIDILKEKPCQNWQNFGEFMTRRFAPSIRTCEAARQRLLDLSSRAERVSTMLRTKVDVSNQTQNKQLLASMNQRADIQLRLQETVEGLSVVAISYYALSLLSYLIAPVTSYLHWNKAVVLAIAAVPLFILVLLGIRRIRKQMVDKIP